jgi:hypothetical protein
MPEKEVLTTDEDGWTQMRSDGCGKDFDSLKGEFWQEAEPLLFPAPIRVNPSRRDGIRGLN